MRRTLALRDFRPASCYSDVITGFGTSALLKEPTAIACVWLNATLRRPINIWHQNTATKIWKPTAHLFERSRETLMSGAESPFGLRRAACSRTHLFTRIDKGVMLKYLNVWYLKRWKLTFSLCFISCLLICLVILMSSFPGCKQFRMFCLIK